MNYIDVYKMIKQANEYVTKAGDTLSQIAANNNIKTTDLAKWNNITDPNKIGVGQKLRLTAPTTPQQVPIYNRIQIQPGMTMGGLAKTYNTSVDHLARVNHITNPNNITAGKYMLVPTGQMTGTAKTTTQPVQPKQTPAKFDVNTPLSDELANKVMNNLWIAESGKGKWLTNNKSSASGHFHWTNATWKDFQKANPNDTAGMTKANLNDYNTASKFQLMKLKSDALKYQKATGKPATEQALYAIHYGGFGGRNTPGAINYSNMLSAPDFAKNSGY
jgi:LysM repeat protein